MYSEREEKKPEKKIFIFPRKAVPLFFSIEFLALSPVDVDVGFERERTDGTDEIRTKVSHRF